MHSGLLSHKLNVASAASSVLKICFPILILHTIPHGFAPKLNWESETRMEKEGGCLSRSHLVDLFLTRGGTVIGAVSLAVAVAGFAVSAGAAAVTQLLLLVPSLILVLVVQYSLKIHHCPGVPGLWTDCTN